VNDKIDDIFMASYKTKVASEAAVLPNLDANDMLLKDVDAD
jgi:hypothetical protein